MNIGFAGCSYTYGSELDNPEETRWSKLVCNILNATEHNFAKAGSSNDRICKSVFDSTNKSHYDFFIIQVTSDIRFSLVLNRSVVCLGPTQRHKDELYNLISKLSFLKYHTFDDNVWHELSRWKLICLHHYLNSINLKHMFVFMNESERVSMKNDIMTPPSFTSVCSNISLAEYCLGSGFPMGPNKHPLEKGHEGIVKDIILPKLKELL